MKENKNDKQKVILSILSISVILLLVVGISYAWINFNLFGTKKNTIVVGTLTVILDDNLSNGINLINAYPMNQTNGMKTPSYTFKVTNTGYKANYTIKLINEAGTTTPDTAVRMYYKKNNEVGINKLLSEVTNRVLDSGAILKDEVNNYELKLWIDYDAGNEIQGTVFNSKIKVEVNQAEEQDILSKALVKNLGVNGTVYEPVVGGTKYIRSAKADTAPHLVNNYVWWSGMMWRIFAINPDGSMKAITDDNVSAVSFHNENGSNAYFTSHLKQWLETYFYPRLNSSKDTVLKQNNDFCIDSVADADKDITMRTTCTNKLSNLKVGLLTLDEYNIIKNGSNTNYLNNGTYYWLMTPHASGASVEWCGSSDGGNYSSNVSYSGGSRSVTVFAQAVTISGGNGTLGAPYKIMGDTAPTVSGTKLNSRHTGEFITYDNKLWRIMEVKNGLTKVIYDGATKLTTDAAFGLNNLDWVTMKTRLDGIGISTTKIAQNQTWQRGYMNSGNNVLITSLGEGNPVTSTFGLPKVGEMWASQNNNKATNYAKFTDQTYWLMTPYTSDASREWCAHSGGGSSNYNVSYSSGSRLVFFFAQAVTISSGDGTPNSPYTLN